MVRYELSLNCFWVFPREYEGNSNVRGTIGGDKENNELRQAGGCGTLDSIVNNMRLKQYM